MVSAVGLKHVWNTYNPFFNREETVPALVEKIQEIARSYVFPGVLGLIALKVALPATIAAVIPTVSNMLITYLAMEIFALVISLEFPTHFNPVNLLYSINQNLNRIALSLENLDFFKAALRHRLFDGTSNDCSNFLADFVRITRKNRKIAANAYALMNSLSVNPLISRPAAIKSVQNDLLIELQLLRFIRLVLLEAIQEAALIIEFFDHLNEAAPLDRTEIDEVWNIYSQEVRLTGMQRSDLERFFQNPHQHVVSLRTRLDKYINQKMKLAPQIKREELLQRLQKAEAVVLQRLLDQCDDQEFVNQLRGNAHSKLEQWNQKRQDLQKCLTECESYFSTKVGKLPMQTSSIIVNPQSGQQLLFSAIQTIQKEKKPRFCILHWEVDQNVSAEFGRLPWEYVTLMQLTPKFRLYDPQDKFSCFNTLEEMVEYQLEEVQFVSKKPITCRLEIYGE